MWLTTCCRKRQQTAEVVQKKAAAFQVANVSTAVTTVPVPCLPQSNCSISMPVLCMETLIPIIPAPMASAPITPAPPTLSLEDENAIRVMKSTNEKRVAKRTLAEFNKAALVARETKLAERNKAALAAKRTLAAPVNLQIILAAPAPVKRKCKKCSLPALAGNYGFCGVMHRVQGIDFL